MTLDAARKIDAGDEARVEISLIKFYAARVLNEVIDRAVQVHGALGLTDRTPLATMLTHARGGPDLRRPGRGPPHGRQPADPEGVRRRRHLAVLVAPAVRPCNTVSLGRSAALGAQPPGRDRPHAELARDSSSPWSVPFGGAYTIRTTSVTVRPGRTFRASMHELANPLVTRPRQPQVARPRHRPDGRSRRSAGSGRRSAPSPRSAAGEIRGAMVTTTEIVPRNAGHAGVTISRRRPASNTVLQAQLRVATGA